MNRINPCIVNALTILPHFFFLFQNKNFNKQPKTKNTQNYFYLLFYIKEVFFQTKQKTSFKKGHYNLLVIIKIKTKIHMRAPQLASWLIHIHYRSCKIKHDKNGSNRKQKRSIQSSSAYTKNKNLKAQGRIRPGQHWTLVKSLRLNSTIYTYDDGGWLSLLEK